jgi:hypothetical protein
MLEKLGIIIVVNLILYFKTLRFKFVSDDFSVWKNPPKFKNNWHRRWLQVLGQAKIYSTTAAFKRERKRLKLVKFKNEQQEHFFTLLIHILICILIYFAFGKTNIAFLAALLYSVNPANNQGTIWPGGRGYALPMVGLLSAMALPYISPIMLFFCSSFTIGFLAPLALIGSAKWYLLALMPIVWLLHSRKFVTAVKTKHGAESFTEDNRFHARKIILAIKTFGFYLTLCLIPFRITFYHAFLQSCAGNIVMRKRAYSLCKFFWIGLTVGIGWIIYSWHNWNSISWALFAFMITIAPFCNLKRANQEIAERFTALPNIFLMYFLAQILIQWPIAITIFLVFYATRTFYTLMLYKDEYWITECAVVEDPHAWWAWHCRGMKRWDTKSYKEALILWVMANLISPKEFKVLMNIATVLRLLKNDKEADQYLQKAAENIVEGQEKESWQFIKEHKNGKLPILL